MVSAPTFGYEARTHPAPLTCVSFSLKVGLDHRRRFRDGRGRLGTLYPGGTGSGPGGSTEPNVVAQLVPVHEHS